MLRRYPTAEMCVCFVFQDRFYAMSKTTQWDACLQFVQAHLVDIQHRWDACTSALTRQAQTCPATLTTAMLDERLRDYISSQQTSFSRKLNYQLATFKQEIQEKSLHQALVAHTLTNDQVRSQQETI